VEPAGELREFQRRSRHLPHWEEPGATYFLTFALRRPPVTDLTAPEIGPLVVGALRRFDGERYWLYDYTVMPDHVHVILKPIVRHDARTGRIACPTLSRILGPLKGAVAHQINQLLGRSGPLWQDETYDHILRNPADYQEKAAYIFQNAHTAGLQDDPADWPWWGKGSGWSA